MLRYLTAGESHGKALTAIIEGMPSGLKIDREIIKRYMAARQSGYGRGGRQQIERDEVEFLSGVRGGITIASPVALMIENHDYVSWADTMDVFTADVTKKQVTRPRAGHADLVGSLKYGFTDCRNVLERASARQTAIRVAVGATCMSLLTQLGVEVCGYVMQIGGAADKGEYTFSQIKDATNCGGRIVGGEAEMRAEIDRAAKNGDTVGGKVQVRISGVAAGLGSYVEYDRKLDAHLAFALMSVQAAKGVEVGIGSGYIGKTGSQVMDEIIYKGDKFSHSTNYAGGIEGGMSNGEDIILSAIMKPIPTLKRPLSTVDLITKQTVEANYERSDVAAVEAFCVVCECAAAFEIAKFILNEVNGNTFSEIEKNWKALK